MRYKAYSFLVIVITFIIVTVIYFVFGNSALPEQKEIQIQETGELYEMDKEILELEHSDPT